MVQATMTVPSSVLLVTPRWVRDGGVGAHIEASAAALTCRGVHVSVVAARIESEERIAGVEVHHSPQLFKADVPVEQRFGQALASRPAVVHLNQLDEPEVVEYLQERHGAPVVISAHGYLACTSGVHYFRPGQECTRAHGPGCVPNLLRCAHTRDPRNLPASYKQAGRALAALRRADLAVSYSSAVDRHLEINAVGRRRLVPYCPTVQARSAGGHAERRLVVCAGRVVTPKGVSTLIRAARLVDAHFVVAGDGWQLEAMHRLARRLGVQERVTFTGWLAPEALAEQLAEASIVVVPSWWPEPFGLVGIEAFAAGRPVIASATGGIGDWLDDGVSGVMVPAGDVEALARALNELLDDPERQAAMGAAGRAAAAARFSPEHHVTAILDAYGAAIEHWQSSRSQSTPSISPATTSAL
jgi:glycosyltransferase involved in cell wall biosynthesis